MAQFGIMCWQIYYEYLVAGCDYSIEPQTATFDALNKTAKIIFDINDDGTYEGNETFYVYVNGNSLNDRIRNHTTNGAAKIDIIDNEECE